MNNPIDCINFESTIFDSIAEAAPGTYNVRISNYSIVSAEFNPDNTIAKQPYVLIETDDDLISFRIYPARIDYFMRCINRQFNYALSGKTFQQILDCLRTNDFRITISYDKKYGQQVDYK